MGLPARFEDWTCEHARLMWKQVWPGAQQQLENFNKYLRHLKINERYDLGRDQAVGRRGGGGRVRRGVLRSR